MTDLNTTSRIIGVLEGKVDLIVAAQTAKVEQDRLRWHKLYEELNTLRLVSMDLTAVRKSIEDHQETTQNHEKRLDAYDSMRNKAIGGIFVLSLFGSFIAERISNFLGLKE